jgi:hypothetical protein
MVIELAASSESGTDWTLVFALIGTAAGVISALGVLVGVSYWLRTRRDRAERHEREKRVSADVAEMGDRIDQLHRILSTVAEEQRGRRPLPRVSFHTPEGPSLHVIVDKPLLPSLDIEAIVASERTAALDTLLPIADEESLEIGTLGQIVAQQSRLRRLFGTPSGYPVTAADHDQFQKRVTEYERDLREFIAEWVRYLECRRHLVALYAQIDNDGGAPAEDARIRIHFPDPCRRDDLPPKPERPARPKFSPRRSALYSDGLFFTPPPLRLSVPEIELSDRSGPFYEDGSVTVRFEYPAVPHHDPLKTEIFLVGIPESGLFSIDWTIGAKNLARPETGTLTLEVRHTDAQVETVSTLRGLLSLGR